MPSLNVWGYYPQHTDVACIVIIDLYITIVTGLQYVTHVTICHTNFDQIKLLETTFYYLIFLIFFPLLGVVVLEALQ